MECPPWRESRNGRLARPIYNFSSSNSKYESMELRALRYFVALAEELHFGRAARRLLITQPPLSQAIAKLERELGVRLFERTRRKVGLTLAGATFVEEARATLARAAQAVELARRAQRGEVGRLAIGYLA